MILVAVAVVLVAAIAATSQCASHSSRAQAQSPPSTPAPISLSLPTTIHLSTMTNGGAYLAKPTAGATVTLGQALAMNNMESPAAGTQSVLADVTWPSEFYGGKPIHSLTCWVVVYPLPQPANPSLGGPAHSTPVPTTMVQHSVFILDARTGAIVRGFFTK